jgi:DNA-binding response OmpR family regulator
VEIILTEGGYQVISAASADKGLCLGLEFPHPIHLLLADVMLPGMLGPELASQIKAARPSMRVILMSGKAGGELKVLNAGWQFLGKPFLPAALLERVRAVLARGTGPPVQTARG